MPNVKPATKDAVDFYKMGGKWVAHDLATDLCGVGDTQNEALEELATAVQVDADESRFSTGTDEMPAMDTILFKR